MSVNIFEADLHSHRELIVDHLSRHLGPQCNSERYDWLYLGNPHGAARAWFAAAGQDARLVGIGGVFPRKMLVRGKSELGCVLGDFCIHQAYRSMGPALQLQRACLSSIETGGFAFGYDFPSIAMLSIYRRLRLKPMGQAVRLIRPLRAERQVERIVKFPFLARRLSDVANMVLAGRDLLRTKNPLLEVALHEGPCGDEFSNLSLCASKDYGICVERSKEYLNWRYRFHPSRRYEILKVQRRGELLGFGVFFLDGEEASLADLFMVDEPAVFLALLDDLAFRLRRRGIKALNMSLLNAHPWARLACKAGFWMREANPVVACVRPGHSEAGWIGDGTHWFLTHGDRES
jgi:hypothetical protein